MLKFAETDEEKYLIVYIPSNILISRSFSYLCSKIELFMSQWLEILTMHVHVCNYRSSHKISNTKFYNKLMKSYMKISNEEWKILHTLLELVLQYEYI